MLIVLIMMMYIVVIMYTVRVRSGESRADDVMVYGEKEWNDDSMVGNDGAA